VLSSRQFSPKLTDYADTFLEDEQTRQGNILNNKTKEIGQSLMLLIKEGNAEAVVRDLVLSSHFSQYYCQRQFSQYHEHID
jgi:hypothetical protein